STLVAFWKASGDSILTLLSELSGIPWIEADFDIYVVRYYPSVGGADPLTIPLGGMRRGVLNEAAPAGNRLQLNLLYQLSHRILAQAERSEDPFERSLADHPLMQPSPFRRDNLAMLLALVVSQEMIGLDSTYDAYQSAFWQQRTPGREIFEQYLLSEWILSPEQTLANWVINEPYSSRLVTLTRAPRKARPETGVEKRQYVEGLPIKGRLGFSVRYEGSSKLIVDQIDAARLAYACGLREGDAIQRVDGRWPRNQKELVESILAGLDEEGATLTIGRDGQTESVVIQSIDLYIDDETYYWDSFEDSLYMELNKSGDSSEIQPQPVEPY
ncbi:MAG: hypothetical protein DRP45_10005, partial [Candidatus Zixiibacteriota bacterium]